MMKKLLTGALLLAGSLLVGAANAATTVSWLSPANGSSYATGTSVAPTGIASASGVIGGTGLDLVLVLDSSGSMTVSHGGKTRRQYQAEAAIALINSLPTATTSVGIVEFDSDANVVTGLTALTPASNITVLTNAVNSVDAGGLTNIPSGINAATAELTGVNHTAGRAQMMVVISDGSSSGNSGAAAAAAITAGVDAIHSVGIPGHNVSTMQSIAANGNGVYTNVSDLSQIENLFNGTDGNLVGLDKVEVTLPNGTTLVVATDALGNFTAPSYALATGGNLFTAKAYGTDGTTATADLTLYGTAADVPAPAPLALIGLGLLGMVAARKRRQA